MKRHRPPSELLRDTDLIQRALTRGVREAEAHPHPKIRCANLSASPQGGGEYWAGDSMKNKRGLKRHKQAGNPIAAWRDGHVVWIAPEDIEMSEEPDTDPAA